jgi:hypothetical protein
VGLYHSMRLLWLLLHAVTPKDILHTGLGPSFTVYIRYPKPCLPSPKIPPIPYVDVLRARPLLYHPHRPWRHQVRLGNSTLADESRLDALDDDVQFDGRRTICDEGMYSAVYKDSMCTDLTARRFRRNGTRRGLIYGDLAIKSCIAW